VPAPIVGGIDDNIHAAMSSDGGIAALTTFLLRRNGVR